MTDSKPTNPKDFIGSGKVPLGLVPAVTLAYGSLGHLEGHLKYGKVNWREAGVRTSIYTDAMLRHLQKFADAGEWADKKTRVPHLGSIIACCGIILDAYHAGKLIDDRPRPNEGVSELIDSLSDIVAHLGRLYGGENPTDYLITGPTPRRPVEAACRRVVEQNADDTAAYLSVPCTCGRCPTPRRPSATTAPAAPPAPGPGPSAGLSMWSPHKGEARLDTLSVASGQGLPNVVLISVPPTTADK